MCTGEKNRCVCGIFICTRTIVVSFILCYSKKMRIKNTNKIDIGKKNEEK